MASEMAAEETNIYAPHGLIPTNEKIGIEIVGERPWSYLIKQDQTRYTCFYLIFSPEQMTMRRWTGCPTLLLHLLSPII